MSLSVQTYTPAHQESWNIFVRSADNSNFLFERNFMEYHSDRFADASVLLIEDEQPVAVFPANRNNDTVYSHQGLTYGGLILAERRNVKKMIEYFYLVIDHYLQCGVKNIVYKPIPSYLCKTTNDFEHFVLNILNADTVRVDTSFVVDYRNELKFQERRRRSVKKGQKAFTNIHTDNNFEAFWNEILIPNLQEKFGSAPVHSLNEIKLLHSRFPDQIKQVNAYIDGEIVAGVTLFDFNKCIHCQYISSNDHGRNTGAIDTLFNTLISEYQKDRTYFSMGTTNNNGNDLNIGLCEWKEGWGAQIHSHFHYRFHTENVSSLIRFIKQDV